MPDNEHNSVTDTVMTGEQSIAQKPKIVLVGSPDDSGAIREYLSPQLYEIHQAKTAQGLSELLSADAYDLIIIDTIVPDEDIVSLIQKISLKNKLFHLFVRSKTDDEVDTVLALELGADDCVALSCSAREIKARVRALLRRRITDAQKIIEVSAERGGDSGSELSYEGWVVNRDRCILFSPTGDIIDLTNAEYGILVKLFTKPGLVRDRSSLLNIDSESSEYDIRSLDVFVSRLRKKMAQYNGQDLIETVRGKGYRLSTTPNRITSGEA
jgi:two-component system torCAD operon response regulator TorR